MRGAGTDWAGIAEVVMICHFIPLPARTCRFSGAGDPTRSMLNQRHEFCKHALSFESCVQPEGGLAGGQHPPPSFAPPCCFMASTLSIPFHSPQNGLPVAGGCIGPMSVRYSLATHLEKLLCWFRAG